MGTFSVLQVVFLLQRHTGYFLIQVGPPHQYYLSRLSSPSVQSSPSSPKAWYFAIHVEIYQCCQWNDDLGLHHSRSLCPAHLYLYLYLHLHLYLHLYLHHPRSMCRAHWSSSSAGSASGSTGSTSSSSRPGWLWTDHKKMLPTNWYRLACKQEFSLIPELSPQSSHFN